MVCDLNMMGISGYGTCTFDIIRDLTIGGYMIKPSTTGSLVHQLDSPSYLWLMTEYHGNMHVYIYFFWGGGGGVCAPVNGSMSHLPSAKLVYNGDFTPDVFDFRSLSRGQWWYNDKGDD